MFLFLGDANACNYPEGSSQPWPDQRSGICQCKVSLSKKNEYLVQVLSRKKEQSMYVTPDEINSEKIDECVSSV